MSPLERLARLLRSRPRTPSGEIETYGQAIIPLVEQLAVIYARWERDIALDQDENEMANAASIQRWEAVSLVDRIRAIAPPLPLAKTHAEVEALALSTARAAQQLSNGYRFHSSRARCDGQALMLSNLERFETLRRALGKHGFSVESDAAAQSDSSAD